MLGIPSRRMRLLPARKGSPGLYLSGQTETPYSPFSEERPPLLGGRSERVERRHIKKLCRHPNILGQKGRIGVARIVLLNNGDSIDHAVTSYYKAVGVFRIYAE